jgi:hypothetical protein
MINHWGKVKFLSKMAIGAIRAKIFFYIISEYMNLNFKMKKFLGY